MLIALTLLLPTAAPTASPAPNKRTERALMALARAAGAQDCPRAVKSGSSLIRAGGIGELPNDVQGAIYELLAACEAELSNVDASYSHALKGTEFDAVSDQLWHTRFAIEMTRMDWDAAVATVEAMAERGRGAALNALKPEWLGRLHRELEDADKTAARRRLLEVLAGDGYSPDILLGSTDHFRLWKAQMLAEAGDISAAAATLATIADPTLLRQASIDPLLRRHLPTNLQLKAAAEKHLAKVLDQRGRHPDQLQPILDAAELLRDLGRPQEALEILNAAGPKAADPQGFADRDRLNWYWDSLGRTYTLLGQYDPMVESFRKGVALGESGTPNVSQAINLAEAQTRLGRPTEALKTLELFSDGRNMSPYGRAELRFARGCALTKAGRPEEAAKELAYLKEHEGDHREALTDLLLCLGDLDGAAASFIRRLDDPKRRADALEQLSIYADPPPGLPPHPIYADLPRLRDRADLRAAIERAGGLQTLPFQRGDL